jgi:alpha-L-fucosidase
MDKYIEETAMPQVRELLTNYGPDVPAVFWWDTPRDMNYERARKLYDVAQSLRPDLIFNNRLGGGFDGDTETPEQKIPANGFPGRDWETCMTLNHTWGYKSDDHDWKSSETLIRNLCDIASKGGNYLLNVGPTSEGLIPEPSIERLAEIGAWMKVNGAAIYGTSATPFGAELGEAVKGVSGYGQETLVSSANDWRCTSKPGKLYPIVFNWPADGKLVLPGLRSKVVKASLLADGTPLKSSQTPAGVVLDLPAEAPDKIASVICVEIADKAAKVDPAEAQ